MFLPSNITLAPGDSGDFVRELQRRLSTLSLFSADSISGFYDGMTTSAVTSFQFQQGLRGDGVAGPETLRRLNGVLSGTADSTPATTPATTEDVMKTFYMVDHMQDEIAPVPAPDAFTFQPFQPDLVQTPPAMTPVQPVLQQAAIPQHPQPTAAPAMPDPSLFLQPVAAPAAPHVIPHEQPAPKPDLTPPQPATEKPLQPQPAPQQPQPDVAVKPVHQQPHPIEQPIAVKPVEPVLQPVTQPQPATEKPLQPQPVPLTPQPQQPVLTEKPLEHKPPHLQPQPHHPAPEQKPAPAPQDPATRTVEARAPEAHAQLQKPAPEHKPAVTPQPQENQEAAPERQTLRQRFTGMMQRVADYMEAKLPPSVQAEVQKIGVQMNERGIREVPLPPNETALPSPGATPGRGPAQTAER